MNSLALDYFALEEELGPHDQVEDLPVGQVKWHWDAPPLAAALMQVQCPVVPPAFSFSATELAAELDCFCSASTFVPFPKAAPRLPRQELLEDECWTGWNNRLSNAEVLNQSHQWLSQYAAQKAQEMSADEAAAIKQVDQECEWMNQLAESHDLTDVKDVEKDVEMQGTSPTAMEVKTKMFAAKTDANKGQESIAPSTIEISSQSRAVLPVHSQQVETSMPQTDPEDPDPPNPCNPQAGQAQQVCPPPTSFETHREAPAPLSKVWQPAAATAGKGPFVHCLNLKELGVDSLPSIWTLENLPEQKLPQLPSVVAPPRSLVVDGRLKLLGHFQIRFQHGEFNVATKV